MNAEKTGRFISELRKEKDMTQQDLADRLYVSDKAVSRWETGRGFPEIGILEELSSVLNVSIAELLKGERIQGEISSDDLRKITDDSFRISKDYLNRKRLIYFLSGLLMSAIVLITLIVHLNAPVFIADPDEAIEIRKSGDMLIGVLDEDVTDCDIEYLKGENGEPVCFVSCYQTKWDQYSGRRERKIIVLSDGEDIGDVWYYPHKDGDVLIYSESQNHGYGVETLPRLIYNYWLLLGVAGSIIMIVLYLIMRKRSYGKMLFKAALIPVSFVISLIIVLAGHFDEVYNAAYYFSSIVLLSICIYVLIMVIPELKKKKKVSEA